MDRKRPFILLAAFCIIEIFLVLCLPQYFYGILGISLTLSIIALIFFLKSKKYITACVVVFIMLFSCINPYRLYIENELYCQDLCDRYGDKETVFTAEVIKFSDYGSYSATFARLKTADGEAVGKNPKIRVGSYTNTTLFTGDTITFTGKPTKLSEIEETDFDTSTYLRGKNTFIDFESAKILSSSGSKTKSPLEELQRYTKRVLYHYLHDNFDFGAASVAYAMFSGDKDYISNEINLSFRESGISHILCVSGLHMSIIVSALFAFLSWLTVGKKTSCIIVVIFGIFYCAFTGFALSTIRACIMTCLAFIAMIFGKKTDGYSSLFFAALIICTFSPYSVFDLSAILSFLATFGIILFSDILPQSTCKSSIANLFIDLFAVVMLGTGAFIFTIPICSRFFGTISIFSVIATILATPFCSFLLTSTLCLLALSPLSFIPFVDGLLYAIGGLCRFSANAIMKIADFFCSSRFASITSLFSDIHIILLIIFVITLSVLISLGKRKIYYYLAILMVIIGIVFSFISLYSAINKDVEYTVSYFRKSEEDRQLTVKLGTGGYFIVNADSEISRNYKKAVFDTKEKRNYLLIVPDRCIIPSVLAESIEDFDNDYGIKKIFVPNTIEGAELSEELKRWGVDCFALPEKVHYNDITLEFYSETDYKKLTVNDNKTKTDIVFGEYYNKEFFDKDSDICAYFTRRTINQFIPEKHEAPDCRIFFTRMAKGVVHRGTENTNSKSDFYIKE